MVLSHLQLSSAHPYDSDDANDDDQSIEWLSSPASTARAQKLLQLITINLYDRQTDSSYIP